MKPFHQKPLIFNVNNANLYEPDSARKSWLLSFADTSTAIPARVYALLAVNDTFLLQPDVYIPESAPEESPAMTVVEELRKENAESEVNIYPNPTQHEISLEWKGDFHKAVIKVFDLNGKLMEERTWHQEGVFVIKVGTWSSGTYLIKINTGSKTITRKVLIER